MNHSDEIVLGKEMSLGVECLVSRHYNCSGQKECVLELKHGSGSRNRNDEFESRDMSVDFSDGLNVGGKGKGVFCRMSLRFLD